MSDLITDLTVTASSGTPCPGTHEPLFNSLKTPFIRHYCDCNGTKTSLDLNYLTLSSGTELSAEKHCPSGDCTLEGGDLSRDRALLNIIYGKRICVQTVSLDSLFSRKILDYTIVNSASRCPETFNPCGYLNPTSYLCAARASLCPINSLQILPTDTNFAKAYYSEVLDGQTSLFYSFEEKGNFLVTNDFRLGFEAVCLDDLEMKVKSGVPGLWEFWDNTFTTACGLDSWEGPQGLPVYTDPRYKSIGKVNWRELYADNKVDQFLANQGHDGVDVQTPLDYEVSIYFRYALRFNR